MTNNGYQQFAEALVFAHGSKALSEAKRHAEFCLKQGDIGMAAHWQAAMAEVRHFNLSVPCKTDYSPAVV